MKTTNGRQHNHTLDDGHREYSQAYPPGSSVQTLEPPEPPRARELDFPREIPRMLTIREREIVSGICDGKRNYEIAQDLGISTRTVEKHVENILRKYRVKKRSEAAHLFRTNFLCPDQTPDMGGVNGENGKSSPQARMPGSQDGH